MGQTQNKNAGNEFEIVKNPVIYYEVCVHVHNDGRRTSVTYPVDIGVEGVEQRSVPDGTTIVACVPATCITHAVFSVDEDGGRTFLGYDVPGTLMDWQSEARKYVEEYGNYED